jgi:hypothetical protein
MTAVIAAAPIQLKVEISNAFDFITPSSQAYCCGACPR